MAERNGRALLAWMNGLDLRPNFIGAGVTNPPAYEQFKAMWRAAQVKSATLAAIAPFNRASVQPLPGNLAARSDALTDSELYLAFYDHFTPPATLASIPLSELITPQWWVDADHVDTLTRQAPAQADADGIFNFCFRVGRLERPAVLGPQGNLVEFVGHRRDIGPPSAIRIEDYQPEKIRFSFDVLGRPNFIYVALLTVPGMSLRALLLNGVHHAAALLRAGHARAYCVLKEVSDFGELEVPFNDPGFFKPGRLAAPRPPLLTDYFAPNIADDVSVYALDQRARLIVNFEQSYLPEIDR